LVGKAQSAVSLWEQGQSTPDLEDLIRIVRELDMNVEEILAGAYGRQPVRAALRAEAKRLYEPKLAKALDLFAEEAERSQPPRRQLRIANDSPVAAAVALLAKAGITEPPVPVHELANRCGVRVLDFLFTDGVSGLLLELETGAAIGYHSGEPAPRRRLTVAHELGHHLLGHYESFHIDPTRTVADGHPPGYDWKYERAANDFAAELLMPATWVSDYARQVRSSTRLAQKFQVSRQAMSYRLVDLGLR